MSTKKPNRTKKLAHYNGYDIGEARSYNSETNIITKSHVVLLKNRKSIGMHKFKSVEEAKSYIDKNPK